MNPYWRTVVAALLVATPTSSAANPALPGRRLGGDGSEVGVIAPAGRWPTSGGNLARTGVTRTSAMRGPLSVAWAVDLPGEIEGEPLVWDQRVLVAVRLKDDHRALITLDLSTGERTMAPYRIASSLPLEPSLWAGVIVARTAEDRLVALRWERKKITQIRSHSAPAPVGAPLLRGSEMIFTAGGGLECRRITSRTPIWRVEGGFRGRPSQRGGEVFALAYDERGIAHLVAVDRANGDERDRVTVGPLPAADAFTICVLEESIYVVSDEPFEFHMLGEVYCVGYSRPFPDDEMRIPLLPGSTLVRCLPAAWRGGWLAFLRDSESQGVLGLSPDAAGGEITIFATGDDHPEFVAHPVPPSIAGNVAYLGARAVALDTGRVLWKGERAPRLRAVPARETLLLVEGQSRLVALREERRAPGSRSDPAARIAPDSARFDGLAILNDGSILVGELELRPDSGELAAFDRRGRETLHPLAAVLFVEREVGAIAYLAGLDALSRAMEILIETGLAAGYAELAEDARSAKDPALMRRLVHEAMLRGAEDKTLGRVRAELERLELRPGSIKPDRVRAIVRREAGLSDLPARTFWTRFEALPDDASLALRLALLDGTLLHADGHPGATETVRQLLPEGLRAGEPFDARDWIAFLRATAQSPVEIVPMPGSEREVDSYAGEQLLLAKRAWRDDLVGFRSEHLLIITSLARPGAIARCLSLGELVCEALEEVFEGGEHPRTGADTALVLFLYETREEYLGQSSGGMDGGVSSLEWTAGHYDIVENVSRIFLPAGGEAIESVLRTYVHELTHHWLRVQCPLFSPEESVVMRADIPGYWIAEGFASLVEEFQFEPGRRTWSTFYAQSERLDTLANAREDALLPWGTVFGVTQQQFQNAVITGSSEVGSTWYLGRVRELTPRHLFYHQAASTCQYLFHAEHGAHRPALLRYLARYYTGRAAELGIEGNFGVSPEALGAAATRYALAVAAGERP